MLILTKQSETFMREQIKEFYYYFLAADDRYNDVDYDNTRLIYATSDLVNTINSSIQVFAISWPMKRLTLPSPDT